MGFTIRHTFEEMLKHINWSLCWLYPKYANVSGNFQSGWTVFVIIFLNVRSSTLILTDVRTLRPHPWMTICLLSIEWLNSASHINFFYFKVSFYQYSKFCLSIVQKHLAQSCGYITLANLQTFYQMSCLYL